MSRRVSLAHRPNFLKARLLAPFSARYRARLTLAGEPEALLVVANHVVVTRDRRLALVKNSKAGCTSAAQLLYAYDTGAVFDGRIHRAEDQIAGPLHVRAGLDALAEASVYKFTFVRNPLSRCVSAFQDFVLDRTNPGVRHHLPRLPAFGWRPDAPEADQFDAFLTYVEASFAADRVWTDPHFRCRRSTSRLARWLMTTSAGSRPMQRTWRMSCAPRAPGARISPRCSPGATTPRARKNSCPRPSRPPACARFTPRIARPSDTNEGARRPPRIGAVSGRDHAGFLTKRR